MDPGQNIPSSHSNIKTTLDVKDEIWPSDGVSDKEKQRDSNSKFSTASSACLKAEAEVATFIREEKKLKNNTTRRTDGAAKP